MDNLDKHKFHWKIETSKGVVNVRADAVIKGNAISFHNLSVRADGKNRTGLNSEMQAARSELYSRLREQGFERVEGFGERVPGSTSAKPGKQVNFSIDLTKNTLNSSKAFQPHADPIIRYGQNANRLQAVEKPFQTKLSIELNSHKSKSAFQIYQERLQKNLNSNIGKMPDISSNIDKQSERKNHINRLNSLQKAHESRQPEKQPTKAKGKEIDYE